MLPPSSIPQTSSPITEAAVLEAMPASGLLREYVDLGMRMSESHAGYHLNVGLGVLSAAAPPHLGLPWGSDQVRANWWALLVGPSGDGKTGAVNFGIQILKAAAPDSPCSDTPGSPEMLGELMREPPHKRLVPYRELGRFLSQSVRGYAMPLREMYTELYDSQEISVRYKQAKSYKIPEPRLSLMGGVTPAHLAQHTGPADWEGGFLGRFCTISAETARLIPIPTNTQPARRQKLIEALGLLAGQFAVDVGECQGFTDEAEVIWTAWYRTLPTYPAPDRIRGAIKRSQAVALKAALLFSLDTGAARPGAGRPWKVPVYCMEPAIKLAELHLKSLIYVTEHLGETPDMRDRQGVYMAILKGAREIGEIMGRARLLRKRTEEILDSLVTEGVVRREKQRTGGFEWTPVRGSGGSKDQRAGGQVIDMMSRRVLDDEEVLDLDGDGGGSDADAVTLE